MPSLTYANSSSAATVFTAATEVAALQISDNIPTIEPDGQGVNIDGIVTFTAGGTAGTVTATVRQGLGLSGAIVKQWVVGTTVIATNFTVPINVTDPAPPPLVPAQYTISLTVAGANGTGVYASAKVTILDSNA